MKRNVRLINGKVVVRARPEDAVARVRKLRLEQRLAGGGRLADEECDLVLIALLQERGILPEAE